MMVMAPPPPPPPQSSAAMRSSTTNYSQQHSSQPFSASSSSSPWKGTWPSYPTDGLSLLATASTSPGPSATMNDLHKPRSTPIEAMTPSGAFPEIARLLVADDAGHAGGSTAGRGASSKKRKRPRGQNRTSMSRSPSDGTRPQQHILASSSQMRSSPSSSSHRASSPPDDEDDDYHEGANSSDRCEEEDDEDEDDEDEDEEGGETEVEAEEAPIDWSTIDPNVFFQTFLNDAVPSASTSQQGPRRPQQQQQQHRQQVKVMQQEQGAVDGMQPIQNQPMDSSSFAPAYTPNGSLAAYQPNPSYPSTPYSASNTPAASVPNYGSAIDLLTTVLGSGQEVPPEILSLILSSIAPSLGYQPHAGTPSQWPSTSGVDDLVPLLRDLIEKQQAALDAQTQRPSQQQQVQQVQQRQPSQQQQQSSSSIHAGNSNQFQNQFQTNDNDWTLPFVSLSTPAEDDEDDEVNDPSWDPRKAGDQVVAASSSNGVPAAGQSASGEGSAGRAALDGVVQRFLMGSSPYANGAEQQQQQPSPFQDSTSDRGGRSPRVDPSAVINASAPPSASGVGPSSSITQRRSRVQAAEADGGGEGAQHSTRDRVRRNASPPEQARRRGERSSSLEEGDHSESLRHVGSQRRVAPSWRRNAQRDDDSEDFDSDEDEDDANSKADGRSADEDNTVVTDQTVVAKRSNRGRKPIYRDEESRKAARLEKNRLYQKEYRDKKRAEKAEAEASATAAAGASTSRGAAARSAKNGSRSAVHSGSNGPAAHRTTQSSVAGTHSNNGVLRDQFNAGISSSGPASATLERLVTELQAETRLLRAEMESLRRENVDLRVRMELQRSRGSGGNGSGGQSKRHRRKNARGKDDDHDHDDEEGESEMSEVERYRRGGGRQKDKDASRRTRENGVGGRRKERRRGYDRHADSEEDDESSNGRGHRANSLDNDEDDEDDDLARRVASSSNRFGRTSRR
ncbi:unnamed protein product [Jaminaea pallidilutea]